MPWAWGIGGWITPALSLGIWGLSSPLSPLLAYGFGAGACLTGRYSRRSRSLVSLEWQH